MHLVSINVILKFKGSLLLFIDIQCQIKCSLGLLEQPYNVQKFRMRLDPIQGKKQFSDIRKCSRAMIKKHPGAPGNLRLALGYLATYFFCISLSAGQPGLYG